MAELAPWEKQYSEPAPWDRAYEEPPNAVVDAARAIPTAMVKGAADVPGSANTDALISFIKQKAKDWFGASDETLAGYDKRNVVERGLESKGLLPKGTADEQRSPFPNSEAYQRALEHFTGPLYEPKTGAGKATENVVRFIPGAMSSPTNAVRFGLIPGLLSEGAGQVADRYAPEYSGDARLAGGLGGTAIGGKIISPNLNEAPNAAIRRGAVDTLRREGVPIDPGAEAGSKNLTYLYDELNPERYQRINGAFTKAAMRRAGVDDLATFGQEGTIPRIHADASQRFESAIAGAPGLIPDAQFFNSVSNRVAHATKPGLFDQATQDAVRGAETRINDLIRANGGIIPPREYQTLRSDLNEQARALTDPRAGRMLHATVDDLDKIMERNIAGAGGNVGAFREARDYYKKYLTLADAADDATGYISPPRLQNAVKKVYSEGQVEKNETPFSKLSRAGDLVLGEAKSSGTAERAGVKTMLRVGGGILPAFALSHMINGGGENLIPSLLAEGGVGMAGAAVAKPIMRSLIDNGLARKYLGNQAAHKADDILSVPGLLSTYEAGRRGGE